MKIFLQPIILKEQFAYGYSSELSNKVKQKIVPKKKNIYE